MKTISIKVPNWFPTSENFRRYKEKFIKWLYPPRCSGCNIRVSSHAFSYRMRATGTHPLGFKNSHGEFGVNISSRPFCVSCARKFLHALPRDVGKCTMCEAQSVPVLGHRYVKNPDTFVTFLWYWWNGSDFCMNCVDKLLDNGYEVQNGTH